MIDTAQLKQAIPPREFYAAQITGLKAPDSNGWAEGGVCLFHDDKRPGSFYVNLTSGGFHCHSCLASGGDLIAFVMKRDNITFQRACEVLVSQERPHQSKPKPLPKLTPKPGRGVYGAELWLKADWRDVATHPYAIAKGIDWAAGVARGIASGKVIGRDVDCLIVPIRDVQTDKVVGVQAINAQGHKQSFGQVSGNGLILGNTLEKNSYPWYVAEGWASAVSMVFHHQKGNGVCAVSFGKSNQERLAERIAEVYAPAEITILIECDK